MSDKPPVLTNQYWEILTEEDLIKYDSALTFAYLAIEQSAQIKLLETPPNGPLTPRLISIAESRATEMIRLAGKLMPSRDAFEVVNQNPVNRTVYKEFIGPVEGGGAAYQSIKVDHQTGEEIPGGITII